MKVRIFEPDYDAHHRRLLRALAEGIPGAEVGPVTEYRDCDVAVIFGLVKRSYQPTWSKGEIIRRHRGPVLVLERGYVRREHYWSLGWGGINGRADFCNRGMPGDRWAKLGVELKPWKIGGDYVLVCGQVPWDTSVQFNDHMAWLTETFAALRREGRPVRFRPHPRVADRVRYPVPDYVPVDVGPLHEALAGASHVVTFNSNIGVDATLDGVPTYAADEGAMVWGASHGTLAGLFGDIRVAWRETWAYDIAYAQWTEDELRSGEAWKHVRRGIEDGSVLRPIPLDDHGDHVEVAIR